MPKDLPRGVGAAPQDDTYGGLANNQDQPKSARVPAQRAATQRSLSAQTFSARASSRASALGVAMAQSER